jgi:FkbM family methyltransferase
MSMLGHYASFTKGESVENQFFENIVIDENIVGLFERHNITPKGAIHVGAHECPEIGCYSKLFKENVVWIEANPTTYIKAKEVAERNNQKCYNFAAHHTDGEKLTLYIPQREDISSIYPSFEFPVSRVSEVETKTMTTLFKEESLDIADFDFLNIDVEGAELNVLNGLRGYLNKIKYIFIEVSIEPRFVESEATLDKINSYLTEEGFTLVEISSSIQTLGWGDAFYIRQ